MVVCIGILAALTFWISPVVHAASPSFSVSNLNGSVIDNPTSLQFGPDERLYVAQQNGNIKVFTITRNSATSYAVTGTETIQLIRTIPNRNDDGLPNSATTTRQVTGLLVTGTPQTPVLYVSSSDPRIAVGQDSNLDTNSGIITRLTKNGSGWDKIDLVRGLPRNEENHSPNGMWLDSAINVLYLAQGGHTNMGAPSNSFAYQPEYALSAAILAIDLNAINALPTQVDALGHAYKYNLPTLDDPGRTNNPDGSDVNDPFGGNNGANQAILLPGGPVQVYSSGYRNPYDIVMTEAGRMYTIDNGSNNGWGGPPIGEGTATCTNGPNENGTATHNDNLHLVTGAGFYGGHPSPTRGNTANTFNGQSPVTVSNTVECDYRLPGGTLATGGDGALAVFNASTNGLTEYTASNFEGEMRGNLLTASYNGTVYRIILNSTGDGASAPQALFSGFGSAPLDITAQGDGDIFPGTVWVGNYSSDTITVFEPADFGTCTGADNPALDEDQDGYDNADEIDNGTNPCSAASRPPDNDGDFTSDRNDPDDDNDGIPDMSDPFQIDPANGKNTSIPLNYGWAIGDPGFGFFGLGFTGFMTNGTSDYLDLHDPNDLTAGGAAGKLTIDAVPAGDAYGSFNSQAYGFQFGVNLDNATAPFTVHTRVESPYFSDQTPQGEQSLGLFIGTGDQNNYLGIKLHANGGSGGIQVVSEIGGTPQASTYSVSNLLSSTNIDLFISVNPFTGDVQPRYSVNGGAPVAIGGSIGLPAAWFNGPNALAVGIHSTSRGATPFAATWDGVDITYDTPTGVGQWLPVTSSNLPPATHETSYIQVGGKFYLIGGRHMSTVYIFNPATGAWTTGAALPMLLHHIQAVELDGLIYIVGAMSGTCCSSEFGVDRVYIYDPAANAWHEGPMIPEPRRRGAAGVVVYERKIYIVGGLTGGHGSAGTSFSMFDVYDPAANTWTVLPNAPRVRDHFGAAIVGNRLYAAAGRNSGTSNFFNATIGEVDVYDFTTGQWSTLPSASNIPSQRAGTSTVVLGNEIVVIGGEGFGSAHPNTEALDPTTHTWRALAPLIQARHGTNATICNGGVYTTDGSGGQGGSPELNSQEVFFLYGPTTCTAPAVQPGTLSSSSGQLDFGVVPVGGSSTQTVTLSNSGGNQAIVVKALTITGGSGFTVSAPASLPRVLGPGQTLQVTVAFSPSSTQQQSASLAVAHSRTGSPLMVTLVGNGATGPTATMTPGAGVSQYRVNVGGPLLSAADGSQPNWSVDTTSQPSPYSNQPAGGAGMSSTTTTIDLSHPSVPASAPMALFQTERYDTTGGAPMQWSFPVTPGLVEVRLFFAETYSAINTPGQRVFDVSIEGNLVLNDYDVFAASGGLYRAVVETLVVSSDATLNITFAHVVENPAIKAIEVRPVSGSPTPTATATVQGAPTNTATATPSSTPTATATPVLADLIFRDGFESGDLLRWSRSITNGSNLSATNAAALVGSFGMQAVINSNTAIYVQDDTPVAERRYRARFYFDPNSIAMANGDTHVLFAGYTSASIDLLQLALRRRGGNYQLQALTSDDTVAWQSTSWLTISDGPHAVELEWRAASAPGANDGGLTLWLDGVERANVTGIDNDTRSIDQVRSGAVSGIDTGTRGTYFFDAFESRRLSYIGLDGEAGSTSLGVSSLSIAAPPVVDQPLALVVVSEATPTLSLAPVSGMVEAEHGEVQRSQGWVLYTMPVGASGAGYLVNTRPDDHLVVAFIGTAIDINYVENQAFGSFSLELDSQVVREVNTTGGDNFAFSQSVRLEGLTPGFHILRVLPQVSVVAIDSFVVDPPALTGVVIEPTVTPLPVVTIVPLQPTIAPPLATSTPVPTATPAILSLPLYESLDDGAPRWSAIGGWRLEGGDNASSSTGLGWSASSSDSPGVLLLNVPVDLRTARHPTLLFQSRLSSWAWTAVVEVSLDGRNWIPLAAVSPVHDWTLTEVPLNAFTGQVIQLRFGWWPPQAPTDDETVENWHIDEVSVLDIPLLPTVVQPTVTLSASPEATSMDTLSMMPHGEPPAGSDIVTATEETTSPTLLAPGPTDGPPDVPPPTLQPTAVPMLATPPEQIEYGTAVPEDDPEEVAPL